MSDLSFTFLHWRLLEQILEEKLSFKDVNLEQIEILNFNILPDGDTLLHKFENKGYLITELFEFVHPNSLDPTVKLSHIPFLQNFAGKSPMHALDDKSDYRTMDMLLTYLAGYKLDHHSRAISELLPGMLAHDLPHLNQYLESRLCQTE